MGREEKVVERFLAGYWPGSKAYEIEEEMETVVIPTYNRQGLIVETCEVVGLETGMRVCHACEKGHHVHIEVVKRQKADEI